MLSRQHLKAITEPLVMATSESAGPDADVVHAHEVTVPLNEGPQPEAWAGLTPPGEVGIPIWRLE
jgi:hypothetical protein